MKILWISLLCIFSLKLYAIDTDSSLEKLKADIQSPKKGGQDPARFRDRTGGRVFKFFAKTSEFDEILNSPPNLRLVYRMESRHISKKHIQEFEKELQEEISHSRHPQ